jgi:F420-0:gamma-glutamyl ligase-like protein
MNADNEKIERIRDTALQIISERRSKGEKGYILSKDVSDRLSVSHASAALTLHYYHNKWGLVRGNILKNRTTCPQLLAYAEKDEDIPYKPRGKTADEIKELELKKAKKQAADGNITLEEIEQRKKETLPQRIDRMIDNLHKEKGKVDFSQIRLRLEDEFGKLPDSNMTTLALDRYENGIKKGKYFWTNEGYSTMPTSEKSI